MSLVFEKKLTRISHAVENYFRKRKIRTQRWYLNNASLLHRYLIKASTLSCTRDQHGSNFAATRYTDTSRLSLPVCV